MAERPLECNQCKKTARILYKEIKNNEMQITQTCEDCPVIQHRLHHKKKKETESKTSQQEEENRICPTCQTTADEIKMGNYIGCSNCYTVFRDLLVSYLLKINKIHEYPKKLSSDPTVSLHKGKVEILSGDKYTKLGELKVALEDAIQGENFEQAAWLRDRINALMQESSNEAI